LNSKRFREIPEPYINEPIH